MTKKNKSKQKITPPHEETELKRIRRKKVSRHNKRKSEPKKKVVKTKKKKKISVKKLDWELIDRRG